MLIMRIGEGEDDEEVYLPIETEEELARLWGIFQEIYYSDDMGFEDEE